MPTTAHEIRTGDLTVRPQEHRAYVREVEVPLTPREFEVLAALAARPGWVFSADQLAGDDEPAGYASPYAVNVHVSHLRSKLAAAGAPDLIETVRGAGWRLRRAAPGLPTTTPPVMPFVGRQRELAELAEVLTPSAGRFALVCGEPGIGKTSLIERFIADTAPEFLVLRAVCDGGAGTYWLWSQLLRAIDATCGPPLASRAEAALLQRVLGEYPATAAPGPTDRTLIYEAVRSYVAEAGALAPRPLLLFIDDLQWAAETSLGLMRYVLNRLTTTPVALVAACRDIEAHRREALRPIVDYAAQRRDAALITLEGLAADDVTDLMRASWTDGPPPVTAASLVERTAGNPLFLHEYLRLMRIHAGGAGALDHVVAESVAGLVREQLAALPVPTREALVVGAVIGTAFDVTLAAGVAETEAGVFGPALDADIVREVADGTLRFRHAVVRDALLETLDAARRAAVHRQIADHLRAEPAQLRQSHLYRLALHCAWAGPAYRPAAIGYAFAAARLAASRFAFEDEARHLAEARRFTEDAGLETLRSARLHAIALEREGAARAALGDVPQAITLYEHALEDRPAADVMARARLLTRIGYAAALLREPMRCASAYENALLLLESAPDRNAGWWRTWIEVRLAEMEAAGLMDAEHSAAYGEIEPIVERHGTLEQRAKYHAKLALLLCPIDGTWRVTPAAVTAAERAVAIAALGGSDFLRGYALSILGSLLVFAGRLDEGTDALHRALELAQRSADIVGVESVHLHLALAARLQRNVLETEHHARELERLTQQHPALPEFVTGADAHLAWVALQRGLIPEVNARSRRAIELWLTEPSCCQAVWTMAWPAVASALVVGDHTRALECAALMTRHGQQLLRGELSAQLDAVGSLDRHGDTRSAVELLQALVERAREFGYA